MTMTCGLPAPSFSGRETADRSGVESLMRILHLFPHLSRGGAERQFGYLAPELVRMGHDVHVAYSGKDNALIFPVLSFISLNHDPIMTHICCGNLLDLLDVSSRTSSIPGFYKWIFWGVWWQDSIVSPGYFVSRVRPWPIRRLGRIV